MKGLAGMKTDAAEGAVKAKPSPLSSKSTALKQAAESLKSALEAVEACLTEYGEQGEE